MADLADLPWFLLKGNYRGIVPDTLDVGIRPDQYRPWCEVTITPQRVAPGNRLAGDPDVELRLGSLEPPVTVLLLPTVARIDTGALKLPRLPAPAGETDPATPAEQLAQQEAEGVPLLANSPTLAEGLGDNWLAYHVVFGPMTILGRSYTFDPFYIPAPTVEDYDPDDPDWSGPEVDLTRVERFVPAA